MPGHAYVSIGDQQVIRATLLSTWKPEKLLSGEAFAEEIYDDLEKIMQETIKGCLELI